MLICNRTSDVNLQIFEVHVRPFEGKQLAHAQVRQDVEEHGCFAGVLEILQKSFDLLDVQHGGHPLPLCALPHHREGVSVMPLPADRVIEDGVHEIPDLRFAAVRQRK